MRQHSLTMLLAVGNIVGPVAAVDDIVVEQREWTLENNNTLETIGKNATEFSQVVRTMQSLNRLNEQHRSVPVGLWRFRSSSASIVCRKWRVGRHRNAIGSCQ